MGVQRQQAGAPAEADPLAALMDSLAALPRLADQEDEIQVTQLSCGILQWHVSLHWHIGQSGRLRVIEVTLGGASDRLLFAHKLCGLS